MNKKIVVTGSDGFVGKYLLSLLKDGQDRIYPLDRKQADITDFAAVKKYLNKIKPDQVYHLAGFASGAGKNKGLIFSINVSGTLNILKALSEIGHPSKVMLASTAYVYGNTLKPAVESTTLDPKSYYDQSKAEMEKKAFRFLSDKIQIVITRATNHAGPGQKLGFAVSDFCSAVAEAKSGSEIMVGNLSAKRDLFDVRDCVGAYKTAMNKGQSGKIYNIGTGKTVTMKEVLAEIIKISKKKIKIKIDPEKRRASDIAKNCVNPKRIRALGWQPKISLEKTLKDTYRFWRELKTKN